MRRSFAVKTMPNRPFSVCAAEKPNSELDVGDFRNRHSDADVDYSFFRRDASPDESASRRSNQILNEALKKESTKQKGLSVENGFKVFNEKKKSEDTSNLQKVSRRTIQKNAAKERKLTSKEGSGVAELQNVKNVNRIDRTELTIPRRPFVRVIRQILSKFGKNSVTHFSSEAIRAIQLSAEVYLTNMFEDLHILALHARRVTIMPKDFQTLMRLSSRNDKVMMDMINYRNLHRLSQSEDSANQKN